MAQENYSQPLNSSKDLPDTPDDTLHKFIKLQQKDIELTLREIDLKKN